MKKTKKDFEGGPSQQNKGKKGVNMKYFRKTLKLHNISINEVLEFKRKKRAEEKAKKSREAKDKSNKDYPCTELCEDIKKLQKPHVPELNKYLNHHWLQHLKSSKSARLKAIIVRHSCL